MSDALDAAIRAAMDEQGCDPYKCSEDSVTVCVVHDADDMEGWRVDRYMCGPIARAVTVGFEAGRRDALTEAADTLDSLYDTAKAYRLENYKHLYSDDLEYLSGIESSEAAVRLLSTTKEAKP